MLYLHIKNISRYSAFSKTLLFNRVLFSIDIILILHVFFYSINSTQICQRYNDCKYRFALGVFLRARCYSCGKKACIYHDVRESRDSNRSGGDFPIECQSGEYQCPVRPGALGRHPSAVTAVRHFRAFAHPIFSRYTTPPSPLHPPPLPSPRTTCFFGFVGAINFIKEKRRRAHGETCGAGRWDDCGEKKDREKERQEGWEIKRHGEVG